MMKAGVLPEADDMRAEQRPAGAPGNDLEELHEMVASMPGSARRAIRGENVARACKLSCSERRIS